MPHPGWQSLPSDVSVQNAVLLLPVSLLRFAWIVIGALPVSADFKRVLLLMTTGPCGSSDPTHESHPMRKAALASFVLSALDTANTIGRS